MRPCGAGMKGTGHGRALARLLLWGVFLARGLAQVPMGPGSMQPYAGGGGRQRSYGYVREPAMGFFIAGSTIKDMNGVYKRVEQVPSWLPHKFQLAYRKWPFGEADHLDGWHIALVDSPADPAEAGYAAVGGKSSEWVIIDGNGRDRFGHAGETVIPGAGTRWQHVHRPSKREREERDRRKATGEPDPTPEGAVAAGDDEDELPWQVIFIGDENVRAPPRTLDPAPESPGRFFLHLRRCFVQCFCSMLLSGASVLLLLLPLILLLLLRWWSDCGEDTGIISTTSSKPLAEAHASIGPAGARRKSARSTCRQLSRQRRPLSKATSQRLRNTLVPSLTRAVQSARGMASTGSTPSGARQRCVYSRRAACAEHGSCTTRLRR